MAVNAAFCGHGIFTEFSVKNVLNRFAKYTSPNPAQPPPKDKIDRFVHALQDMDVSTVWMQLFTTGSADLDKPKTGAQLRKDLIARLIQEGIQVAGWGYCAAKNRDRDVDVIRGFRKDLGLTAFIIDVESGNGKDLWKEGDFDTFTRDVSGLVGVNNLALSTWPVLQIQDTVKNPVIKMMQIAEPRVCLFAPQAYWMNFPIKVHYTKTGLKEKDFPRNDPTSFVRLVIAAWQKLGFQKPLVITGQAYWGEGSPSQTTMSKKAKKFIDTFKDWPEIIGFNWYHGGKANTAADGSMSDAMIDAIVKGKLGQKPYASTS